MGELARWARGKLLVARTIWRTPQSLYETRGGSGSAAKLALWPCAS
jgi:hypothetical protein